MPQADDEIAWPSTTTFARGIVRSALLQVETCYPAIVEQYRAPSAGRPAQVVARLARKYRRPLDNPDDLRADAGEVLEESTDDAGNARYEAVGDYPLVGWVPVEWPGLAGMHLTGEIAVGEVGMLCNTGRSLDAWQTSGGVADPFGSQQFNLANAVFRPGLRSGADDVVVPATGWRLGADDGTWSIEVTPAGQVAIVPGSGSAKVLLGATNATAAVALATLVQARLDALKTAINAWTPVPNDGGAALKTALAGWLAGSNDVAATKVAAV